MLSLSLSLSSLQSLSISLSLSLLPLSLFLSLSLSSLPSLSLSLSFTFSLPLFFSLSFSLSTWLINNQLVPELEWRKWLLLLLLLLLLFILIYFLHCFYSFFFCYYCLLLCYSFPFPYFILLFVWKNGPQLPKLDLKIFSIQLWKSFNSLKANMLLQWGKIPGWPRRILPYGDLNVTQLRLRLATLETTDLTRVMGEIAENDSQNTLNVQ